MILDVFWSIQAQSIEWFPLDQSINKISRFNTPTWWNITSFDLYLFGQDMFSDFFSVSSNIWSLAEHAFVSDDAHGEVVHRNTMGLFAHHFRCHVARCSRSVFRVVGVPDSGDSEICNLEVAICIEDKILGFYISVQNTFLVKILQ